MNSNKFIPMLGLLILLILAIGSISASEIDSDSVIGDSDANIDLTATQTAVAEVDDSSIDDYVNAQDVIDDNQDDDIVSDNVDSIDDVEIEVGVENSLGASQDSEILASTIQFTESKYSTYFNASGNIIPGKLNAGDTLDFSGTFNSKTFIINIPLILTSSDRTAKLVDSNFKFVTGADGTNVSYLDAKTYIMNKPIFDVYNVNELTFSNNNLFSGMTKSYPIILSWSNNTNIFYNNIQTTSSEVGFGHPSGMVLSNACHNNISSNNIITNDSNGIYLTTFLETGAINNYNYIYNNTVHSLRGVEWTVDEKGKLPLPSSFAYGIQAMGSFNEIINNTVYNVYRGISAIASGNKVIGNIIYNIHGTSLSGNTVEEGGDYGIYVGTNSVVENNTISDCLLKNTGTSAIYVGTNSTVKNNTVKNNDGVSISIAGNDVKILENEIDVTTSYGVYALGNRTNGIIANNIIKSMDAFSIYLQKKKRTEFPHDFIIENNTLYTSNQNPIYCDEECTNITLNNNDIIINVHYISEDNFFNFFSNEMYLNGNVKENDTLIFVGIFDSKGKIYINNKVNILGSNAKFIDTTFIILNNDVSIEDIEISNPNKNNVLKSWGIQLNEVKNVTIKNCNISIYDPDCAYAIYLFNSSDCNIINNNLEAKGNYLTAAILSFASKNIFIDGNTLKSIGTGEKYLCNNNSCLDGYLSICADGCVDGCTDGCVDGCTDGCVDGCIDGCVDGCTDGCVDGCTDGCVDGCTDGCIDGEGSPIDLDGVYPGTHIVKNIFKTYGFLMVHPTNITFTNNKVDVTSSLEAYYDLNESCNAIGGVFIQYGGFNNTISNNEISLDSNDPIAYGIGIVGATANSSAEGSKNNTFSYNNVSIKSLYHAVGISLGNKAIESNISNNNFKIYAVQAHNILNNTGVEEDNNLLDNKNFDVTTRHNTVLIVSDVSYKFNNLNKIISITLKDKNGSSVANKKISVIVDGVTYYGTTNDNGVATVKVSLSKVGIYSITAKFDTEDDFVASLGTGKLTLTKDSTSLTSSGKTYAVTASSKSITLTLKDGSGNVIANKKVTATVNGKTYTATTNSKGVATFKLTLKAVKTFTVSLKFAGDSYYTASSKSIKVKVTKTKTKLTVPKKTYKKAKKVKKLTATLKDQFGKVIKSKKVTFTVNGKKYTARTNKKGVATVKVKLSKKKTYKVTVKFAGDKTYYAVKKTGKVVIK